MHCNASHARTFLESNAGRSFLKVPFGVAHRRQRRPANRIEANMNSHPISTATSLAKTSRFVLLSLAAALSLASYQPVGAQENGEGTRRNSLTGNWYVATGVPVQPGQIPLTALQTYFGDGNLMEESNSTAIRSLGHGSWKRMGDRHFRRTFLTFRFDASRNFTGRSERLATLELSHDGQTFTNLGGFINVYDRAGNLLSSQATGPGEFGVRFRDELPLAPGP